MPRIINESKSSQYISVRYLLYLNCCFVCIIIISTSGVKLRQQNMSQKIDPAILRRYEVLGKIGQGAYGHVWKAKDRVSSQKVAIKKICDAFRNQVDAQRTYRQVMYWKQLQHVNIVKLYALHSLEESRDIYLSMELLDYDLQKIISQSMFSSNTQRFYLFYQLINVVEYLHRSNLIHRDLKPANILLSAEWDLKLCDFGLMRSIKKTQGQKELVMTQNIATRWYRAPQILLDSDDYGKPVDIWSLACIFVEIMTGKTLFTGQSSLDQLEKILQVTGKPSPKVIAEITHTQATFSVIENIKVTQKKSIKSILGSQDLELVSLIQRMLDFDPQNRITIDQIKSHPFFQRFKKVLSPGSVRNFQNGKNEKSVVIDYDTEKLPSSKYRSILNMYTDPIELDQNQKRQLKSETLISLHKGLKKTFEVPESNKKHKEEQHHLQLHKTSSSIALVYHHMQGEKKLKRPKKQEVMAKLNRTEFKQPSSLLSSKKSEKSEKSQLNQSNSSIKLHSKSKQHNFTNTSNLKDSKQSSRNTISTLNQERNSKIKDSPSYNKGSEVKKDWLSGIEVAKQIEFFTVSKSQIVKQSSQGFSFEKIKQMRKLNENEQEKTQRKLKQTNQMKTVKKRAYNLSWAQ